jgi:large subunit ribosomal protein L39e
MAKNKSSALKTVIAKGIKQNRRMPVFVIAKTKRKFTRNAKRRYWRAKKMRVNAGKH